MIKPLGEYVVIKRLEAEEKTQSGIFLASGAKETPQVAEVLEVGPGNGETEILVKKGDKVIFKKYGGDEVQYEGEKLIILPYEDILAVIE